MGFFGYNFTFAGIPSETYNLGIVNFDTGMITSPAGNTVEIYKEEIFRRAKPYFYGVSPRPVLEFPITIGTPDIIDGYTRSLIEKWLFGQQTYQKLQIVQGDIQNSYYNCFLTEQESYAIGNIKYGFNCKVVCDSPYAWDYPSSLVKTYSPSTITTESFNFYNLSTTNSYLYPFISFTLNSIGTNITLINNTDNGRIFTFGTGLLPILTANETITVDNDLQIITSSLGTTTYRLSSFNKNWFRLVSGINNITITGGISNLTMTTQFARSIGG